MTAVRFSRKMRGGSQAHLLKADSGSYYVTKFLQNPQGYRTLINEVVAWSMLKCLGIACRDAALIRITADFLGENPHVYLSKTKGKVQPCPGLHFGSAYPIGRGGAVYDFLPEVALDRVINIREFAGALVFDAWVGNDDYRQAVFYRPPPFGGRNDGGLTAPDAFVVNMIDNGMVFNGSRWECRETPLHGVSRVLGVYADVRSIADFEPWLSLAMQFPEERLIAAAAGVPGEWLGKTDSDALRRLMDRLHAARNQLPRRLQRTRYAHPMLFPNWEDVVQVRVPGSS